jgi:hypothetical protein
MSAIDIARGLTQLRPDWNLDSPYQFGEIGAVGAHGANTVDVYLDGSTSLTTGLHSLADYGPQVNDPVMIGCMQGSSQSARVVLGPLAPGGTIHGGPPTSAPYAGARIFDTKYGVTWWWDGSAWHATGGPGLITANLYLSASTPVAAGSVIPFDKNTTGGAWDPLGLCTVGAGAKFTCPIAGRYRVILNAQATVGTNFLTEVLHQGVNALDGMWINASAAAASLASSGITCAAGDTLQGAIGLTAGITVAGSITQNNLLVEFSSS